MRDLRTQTPESLEEIRKKWIAEIVKAPNIHLKAREILPTLITEHIHTPESLAMVVGVCGQILTLIGQASPGCEKTVGVTMTLTMFGSQSKQEMAIDSNIVKKETHIAYEEKYVANLMPKVEEESKKDSAKILRQSR